MIYTQQDYYLLEHKNDEELEKALEQAKDDYDYVQALYQGEDDTKPSSGNKVPLETIFMHLKNIESYIRRIENLKHEYEIDRTFIRNSIRRRAKRLSKRKEEL